MPLDAIRPAPAPATATSPETAGEPRRGEEEQGRDEAQERPGREAGARKTGERVRKQKGLGELSQGEHERPHTRVVLDLEAEVGVLVHLGEEMGVRALLQEPALALQLGGHGLVGLMEEAEAVEPCDRGDHATAQGEEGEHELAEHIAPEPLETCYISEGITGMALQNGWRDPLAPAASDHDDDRSRPVQPPGHGEARARGERRRPGHPLVGGRAGVCAGELGGRAAELPRAVHVPPGRDRAGTGGRPAGLALGPVQRERLGLLQLGRRPDHAMVGPEDAGEAGDRHRGRLGRPGVLELGGEGAGEPGGVRRQRVRHIRRGAGPAVHARHDLPPAQLPPDLEVLGAGGARDRPGPLPELQHPAPLGAGRLRAEEETAMARPRGVGRRRRRGPAGRGLPVRDQRRPGVLLEHRGVHPSVPDHAPVQQADFVGRQ